MEDRFAKKVSVTENRQRQWRNQLAQAREERLVTQSGRARHPESIQEMDDVIADMEHLLTLPLGTRFNGMEEASLRRARSLVGKTVEIIGVMEDDPAPLAVGDRGVVRRVTASGDQITVDWDSGRHLMLLHTDPFRVVAP